MMDISTAATLACIWEATAPKPGNIYRGADFDDVTYADFLTSASVLGPKIAFASTHGVGHAILEAARAIHRSVGTNTYLGTVLLLAPLAAVPATESLLDGVTKVLDALTADDTRFVYEAVRVANPGGLGKLDEADIRGTPPAIDLVDAMRLAADRDLVARQYVNKFAEVFATAEQIESGQGSLSDRIVRSYLMMLAEIPDSLVARKCGPDLADRVRCGARRVLSFHGDEYHAALADFDFWLRTDGHRRNPGTTADIVAAALFVLLRENRLQWPARFY
jgi:triphosphoribosyl-dephospho-CoA synthase